MAIIIICARRIPSAFVEKIDFVESIRWKSLRSSCSHYVCASERNEEWMLVHGGYSGLCYKLFAVLVPATKLNLARYCCCVRLHVCRVHVCSSVRQMYYSIVDEMDGMMKEGEDVCRERLNLFENVCARIQCSFFLSQSSHFISMQRHFGCI